MRKTVLPILAFLAAAALLTYAGSRLGGPAGGEAPLSGSPLPDSVRAERVEVVNFYGTNRCYSCRRVGELAFQAVKERFPREWADGTVRFVEVNGESPANRETVLKYQATGSSLFLNAVAGGEDHIREDAAVWRLVYSERQFMDHLEGEIRALLGR